MEIDVAAAIEPVFDFVSAEDALPKALTGYGLMPPVQMTSGITGPRDGPGSSRTVHLADGKYRTCGGHGKHATELFRLPNRQLHLRAQIQCALETRGDILQMQPTWRTHDVKFETFQSRAKPGTDWMTAYVKVSDASGRLPEATPMNVRQLVETLQKLPDQDATATWTKGAPSGAACSRALRLLQIRLIPKHWAGSTAS
jgi:hypothetical protein